MYYANQATLHLGYPNNAPSTPLTILSKFILASIILTVAVISGVLSYRISELITYSLFLFAIGITGFSLKDSVQWYRENNAGDCPECGNNLKIKYWTG